MNKISDAIFDTTSMRDDEEHLYFQQETMVESRENTEILFDTLLCASHSIEGGVVSGYSKAASNTMVVGHALGKLTEALYSFSSNGALKTFCIGHSLGSHVCGFTGKTRKLDGIIGLDPAGPIFENNFIDGKLCKGDARFVQALHFDAGEMGIDQAIGHQDIFINGGKSQPGCRGAVSEAACSHTPFALNFVLKMIEQNPEGNLCYTNKKCRNEKEAMYGNQQSCVGSKGVNVEVGALTNSVTEFTEGVFYLNTANKSIAPCYFTIKSLGHDSYGYDNLIKGINFLHNVLNIPKMSLNL